MKEKTIEYLIYEESNKLIEIISSEIETNVFKKRYNLSGDILNNSEVIINNSVSFIRFKPNLGPLIKLKITLVNSNNEGTKSILNLTRINGLTFYIQSGFSLIFSVITFLIVVYHLIINDLDKNDFIFFPIFGIVYFFIIKFIASGMTDCLMSKVENILKTEGIKYKKL